MTDTLPKKRMLGYADEISRAPGEKIRFMVSCDEVESYDAAIVRLISGDRHPESFGFIEEPVATPLQGHYRGRHQPLHAGSYAVIDDWDGFALESFTLQAMIWPTRPGQGRQVVLGRFSAGERRGYALILDEEGAAALEIGDGTRTVRVASGVSLHSRRWAFVGASFDARSGTARLYQEPLEILADSGPVAREAQLDARPARNGVPFLIAADTAAMPGGKLVAGHHFDGKIDAPRVAGAALDRAAMQALIRPAAGFPASIVGAWDFSRDIMTDRIRDISPNRRHGRIVNLPTRAMKGHNWTGEELDWTKAPDHYGAIHFHSDDMYDAGWEPDFDLLIPETMRSGVYAAKLTAPDGEAEYIPFFVRPRRGSATAEAVVLMPTASYLAYANERAGLEGGSYLHAFSNHLTALGANDLWLNDHPEIGSSLYDRHSDGSGVAYSSRLRPILNFRPGVTNSWIGPAGTAPWQFNADLALIAWLEARGIAYDVITDEDLHEEGLALFARYRAVMTGSHPEYYSKEMYDGLAAYLERGGRLMYLGGNGFYWRVAYHRTLPGAMELRRAEDGIRDWVAEGGEYYHSFTGEYGGMWSRMGRPIHALAGIGMISQGFDISSYYRRKPAASDPRAAFVFEGVEGDIIGDFGTVGGGAAGIELDRYDPAQGSPAHALVLASSENHTDSYYPSPEEVNNVTSMMDARQNANLRADMVFFETPQGGAVFSTGSISWLGSLAHRRGDNPVSRITENVLRRFIDPAPFHIPGHEKP
jgi:N,N-dimethylformamidase